MKLSTPQRRDDGGLIDVLCSPMSSRSSPSTSSPETSDQSLLGLSPHKRFTSFYISPMRSSLYSEMPDSPCVSSPGPIKNTRPSKPSRRLLGKGGFGTVFMSCYNSRRVAVKELRPQHRHRSLSGELHAFLVPHSPFVVSALTFQVSTDIFHVVSELVDGGSVQSLLDMEDETVFPIDMRIRAICQVSLGLSHCHSANLLHMDVKPSNVLMCEGGRLYKLSDFGCSLIASRYTIQDGEETVETLIGKTTPGLGTVCYKAPELFKAETASCRADVYSLAMCAFHMLTRNPPFRGASRPLHPHQLIYAVTAKNLRPHIPEIVDQNEMCVYSLLPEMWQVDPFKRPSSSQVALSLSNFYPEHFTYPDL